MPDFENLLNTLIKNEVEFVIIGGFAATVHGVTLLTNDIDICIQFTHDNTEKLFNSLKDYNPIIREIEIPLKDKRDSLDKLKNLYLITELGPIDILSEVAGLGTYEDVLPHSIEIDLFESKCKVLDIDSLIKSKKEMKRPKDIETITQLQAIKEKMGE